MSAGRLVVALALAACGTGGTPAAHEPVPVVLVGIDGLHPSLLDRPVAVRLRELARDGVRAEALVPVFPTKTFPNFYTIVTGLLPDRHGVVSNTMRDSALGWFRLSDRGAVGDGRWWGGEPIWVAVIRAGRRAVSMFWPGSEAAIGGVRPDEWRPFDWRVDHDERIRAVLVWLTRPPPERPAFVTLYFEDVDLAGHRAGPTSAAVDSALARVDRAIGRLRDGLDSLGRRVNLVVVSDHGIAAVAPERRIFLDDLIDTANVDIVELGPIAGIAPRPGRRETAVYRQLANRHPRMAVYRKHELPARFRYGNHPRVPPLVAIADAGWLIALRGSRLPNRGDHGYDHEDPSMAGVFLAAGPAFRVGVVTPPFQNLHVYELLAHLLGLRPAPNDGRLDSVRALLR